MYTYLAMNTVRATVLALRMHQGDNLQHHVPLDPVMSHLALQLSVFNAYTTASMGLLAFFGLYVDYSMHFRLDHYMLNLTNEWIVVNARWFWSLNWNRMREREVRRSGSGANSIQLWRRTLRRIASGRGVVFAVRRLTFFPQASPDIRAKVAMFSSIVDWLFGLLNIGTGKS